MGLLGALFGGGRDYSSMSDDELSERREKAVKRHLKYGRDSDYNIINSIDNVVIGRMNAEYEREHPNGKTRHREHGWYLPNDD